MSSEDGLVSIVIVVFAFLALLVLSSCTKDQHKFNKVTEAYVACIEAQKSVEIDLKCGIGGK